VTGSSKVCFLDEMSNAKLIVSIAVSQSYLESYHSRPQNSAITRIKIFQDYLVKILGKILATYKDIVVASFSVNFDIPHTETDFSSLVVTL